MMPPRAPTFLIRSVSLVSGYSVLILHPNGLQDEKFGFGHKYEAEDWIANDAAQWLKNNR
jgi:hypothetical protein